MGLLRVVRGTILALALAGIATVAGAQSASEGARIYQKLAAILDEYFPDVALEIGESLRLAAPGQWAGVQVNGPYRRGWINIYMIDSTRLRDDDPLEAENVNLRPGTLQGGATSHPRIGIVFLDTDRWKPTTRGTSSR